ncbi:MAG TPA: hypothetical protein VK192_12380 [Sphingomicrobium sp.]|jgi:hypothetical protein|nr:hypothetical protein [Sphingomicrobium sp.]
MEFAGSIDANLRAALQSARRLKQGPVHPDTVEHWEKIVALAKGDDAALQSFKTRELMSDLQLEIEARNREV